VTDLSPVRDMGSLASLGLSDCAALTDVRDLPVLGSVTELRLLNSGLSVGLEKLAERVPRVIDLHLNGSARLADLGQLVGLGLKSLGLWGCRAITDFTPLSDMRALSWLDLEDTTIGDLTPIAGLTELETLWLRRCENVTDLAPLGGLPKLRHLYLAGIAPGTDLAPLAGSRATVYIERSQNVRGRRALGRRVQAD
jgi:Leucine-rich repeat (LRR) protein